MLLASPRDEPQARVARVGCAGFPSSQLDKFCSFNEFLAIQLPVCVCVIHTHIHIRRYTQSEDSDLGCGLIPGGSGVHLWRDQFWRCVDHTFGELYHTSGNCVSARLSVVAVVVGIFMWLIIGCPSGVMGADYDDDHFRPTQCVLCVCLFAGHSKLNVPFVVLFTISLGCNAPT